MRLGFVPDWPLPAGVRAAMSTRQGGASTGIYAALNLGAHVGDAAASVTANRRALAVDLGVANIVWLNQVHGRDVVRLAAPLLQPPTADASVTIEQDLACAVMVADCVPVLFTALDGSCVAAAHAGWRGLRDGVLDATLTALGVPAAAVTAWIGPAIGPDHYEVGAEVRAEFPKTEHNCFSPSRPGHFLMNLKQLAATQLRRAGVTAVTVAPHCAYERSELFYSHRRDGPTGRCAAIIWRTDAALTAHEG